MAHFCHQIVEFFLGFQFEICVNDNLELPSWSRSPLAACLSNKSCFAVIPIEIVKNIL